MDTPQVSPLVPQVYGAIPFEYRVISREHLHPTLKDLAKHIEKMRNSSRSQSYLDLAFFSLLNIIHIMGLKNPDYQNIERTIINNIQLIFNAKIISCGVYVAVPRMDGEKAIIERLYPNSKKALVFLLRFSRGALPILYSRAQTCTAESIIKDITAKGEAPFGVPNCGDLLRTYDMGLFDNNMNLVLVRHPQSIYNEKPVEGLELQLRKGAWVQWFQRPRFEINHPTLRQTVKAQSVKLKPALGLGS